MNNQQQEWLALGIVCLVAAVFVMRWLRQRKQGGSGCSQCPKSSCTSTPSEK